MAPEAFRFTSLVPEAEVLSTLKMKGAVPRQRVSKRGRMVYVPYKTSPLGTWMMVLAISVARSFRGDNLAHVCAEIDEGYLPLSFLANARKARRDAAASSSTDRPAAAPKASSSSAKLSTADRSELNDKCRKAVRSGLREGDLFAYAKRLPKGVLGKWVKANMKEVREIRAELRRPLTEKLTDTFGSEHAQWAMQKLGMKKWWENAGALGEYMANSVGKFAAVMARSQRKIKTAAALRLERAEAKRLREEKRIAEKAAYDQRCKNRAERAARLAAAAARQAFWERKRIANRMAYLFRKRQRLSEKLAAILARPIFIGPRRPAAIASRRTGWTAAHMTPVEKQASYMIKNRDLLCNAESHVDISKDFRVHVGSTSIKVDVIRANDGLFFEHRSYLPSGSLITCDGKATSVITKSISEAIYHIELSDDNFLPSVEACEKHKVQVWDIQLRKMLNREHCSVGFIWRWLTGQTARPIDDDPTPFYRRTSTRLALGLLFRLAIYYFAFQWFKGTQAAPQFDVGKLRLDGPTVDRRIDASILTDSGFKAKLGNLAVRLMRTGDNNTLVTPFLYGDLEEVVNVYKVYSGTQCKTTSVDYFTCSGWSRSVPIKSSLIDVKNINEIPRADANQIEFGKLQNADDLIRLVEQHLTQVQRIQSLVAEKNFLTVQKSTAFVASFLRHVAGTGINMSADPNEIMNNYFRRNNARLEALINNNTILLNEIEDLQKQMELFSIAHQKMQFVSDSIKSNLKKADDSIAATVQHLAAGEKFVINETSSLLNDRRTLVKATSEGKNQTLEQALDSILNLQTMRRVRRAVSGNRTQGHDGSRGHKNTDALGAQFHDLIHKRALAADDASRKMLDGEIDRIVNDVTARKAQLELGPKGLDDLKRYHLVNAVYQGIREYVREIMYDNSASRDLMEKTFGDYTLFLDNVVLKREDASHAFDCLNHGNGHDEKFAVQSVNFIEPGNKMFASYRYHHGGLITHVFAANDSVWLNEDMHLSFCVMSHLELQGFPTSFEMRPHHMVDFCLIGQTEFYAFGFRAYWQCRELQEYDPTCNVNCDKGDGPQVLFYYTHPVYSILYVVALVLVVVWTNEQFGRLPAIILTILIMTAYARSDCAIDGIVFEGSVYDKNATHTVYQLNANVQEGNCVRFGNNTLQFKDISATVPYIFVGKYVGVASAESRSNYGCPGGLGQAACKQYVYNVSDCDYAHEECVPKFNQLYYGTSCGLSGDVWRHNQACFNWRNYTLVWQTTETQVAYDWTMVLNGLRGDVEMKIHSSHAYYGLYGIDILRSVPIIEERPRNIAIHDKAIYATNSVVDTADSCRLVSLNVRDLVDPACLQVHFIEDGEHTKVHYKSLHSSAWFHNNLFVPIRQMFGDLVTVTIVNETEIEVKIQPSVININMVFAEPVVVSSSVKCKRIQASLISVDKGISGNFKNSHIRIDVVTNGPCRVLVDASPCTIVDQVAYAIPQHAVINVTVVCGLTIADSVVLSSGETTTTVKVSGLFRDPEYSLSYAWHSVVSSNFGEGTPFGVAFIQAFGAIGKFAVGVWSAIIGHLWSFVIIVVAAFLGIYGGMEFVDGHRAVGMILAVVALLLIPYASAEDICVFKSEKFEAGSLRLVSTQKCDCVLDDLNKFQAWKSEFSGFLKLHGNFSLDVVGSDGVSSEPCSEHDFFFCAGRCWFNKTLCFAQDLSGFVFTEAASAAKSSVANWTMILTGLSIALNSPEVLIASVFRIVDCAGGSIRAAIASDYDTVYDRTICVEKISAAVAYFLIFGMTLQTVAILFAIYFFRRVFYSPCNFFSSLWKCYRTGVVVQDEDYEVIADLIARKWLKRRDYIDDRVVFKPMIPTHPQEHNVVGRHNNKAVYKPCEVKLNSDGKFLTEEMLGTGVHEDDHNNNVVLANSTVKCHFSKINGVAVFAKHTADFECESVGDIGYVGDFDSIKHRFSWHVGCTKEQEVTISSALGTVSGKATFEATASVIKMRLASCTDNLVGASGWVIEVGDKIYLHLRTVQCGNDVWYESDNLVSHNNSDEDKKEEAAPATKRQGRSRSRGARAYVENTIGSVVAAIEAVAVGEPKREKRPRRSKSSGASLKKEKPVEKSSKTTKEEKAASSEKPRRRSASVAPSAPISIEGASVRYFGPIVRKSTTGIKVVDDSLQRAKRELLAMKGELIHRSVKEFFAAYGIKEITGGLGRNLAGVFRDNIQRIKKDKLPEFMEKLAYFFDARFSQTPVKVDNTNVHEMLALLNDVLMTRQRDRRRCVILGKPYVAARLTFVDGKPVIDSEIKKAWVNARLAAKKKDNNSDSDDISENEIDGIVANNTAPETQSGGYGTDSDCEFVRGKITSNTVPSKKSVVFAESDCESDVGDTNDNCSDSGSSAVGSIAGSRVVSETVIPFEEDETDISDSELPDAFLKACRMRPDVDRRTLYRKFQEAGDEYADALYRIIPKDVLMKDCSMFWLDLFDLIINTKDCGVRRKQALKVLLQDYQETEWWWTLVEAPGRNSFHPTAMTDAYRRAMTWRIYRDEARLKDKSKWVSYEGYTFNELEQSTTPPPCASTVAALAPDYCVIGDTTLRYSKKQLERVLKSLNTNEVIEYLTEPSTESTKVMDKPAFRGVGDTQIVAIKGATRGFGAWIGNEIITCHHVAHSKQLYVSLQASADERLIVKSANKVQAVKLHTCLFRGVHQNRDKDVCIYSMSESPDLTKLSNFARDPVKYELAQIFNPVLKERVLVLMGELNQSGLNKQDRFAAYHLIHVETEVDGSHTIRLVSHPSSVKGWSGLPIFAASDGKYLATFGYMIAANVESSQQPNLGMVGMGVNIGRINESDQSQKLFTDIVMVPRYTVLQAATGWGKSTAVTWGFIDHDQESGLYRNFELMVPKRIAAERLYGYTSSAYKNKDVFLQLKLGETKAEGKTLRSTGSPGARTHYTIQTYGKFNQDNDFFSAPPRKDVVYLLDEVHCREDSNVLLADMLLRYFQPKTKCTVVGMTATPTPDQLDGIHHVQLPEKVRRFAVTEAMMETPEADMKFGYYEILGVKGIKHYIKSSVVDGASTLVFLPTTNGARRAKAHFQKEHPNFSGEVVVWSRIDGFKVPDGAFIAFSTDVAEDSVTIDTLNCVVDLRLKNRPDVGSGVEITRSISIKNCSAEEAAQRRGRVGRVKDGWYFYPSACQQLDHLEAWPKAALFDAAWKFICRYPEFDNTPAWTKHHEFLSVQSVMFREWVDRLRLSKIASKIQLPVESLRKRMEACRLLEIENDLWWVSCTGVSTQMKDLIMGDFLPDIIKKKEFEEIYRGCPLMIIEEESITNNFFKDELFRTKIEDAVAAIMAANVEKGIVKEERFGLDVASVIGVGGLGVVAMAAVSYVVWSEGKKHISPAYATGVYAFENNCTDSNYEWHKFSEGEITGNPLSRMQRLISKLQNNGMFMNFIGGAKKTAQWVADSLEKMFNASWIQKIVQPVKRWFTSLYDWWFAKEEVKVQAFGMLDHPLVEFFTNVFYHFDTWVNKFAGIAGPQNTIVTMLLPTIIGLFDDLSDTWSTQAMGLAVGAVNCFVFYTFSLGYSLALNAVGFLMYSVMHNKTENGRYDIRGKCRNGRTILLCSALGAAAAKVAGWQHHAVSLTGYYPSGLPKTIAAISMSHQGNINPYTNWLGKFFGTANGYGSGFMVGQNLCALMQNAGHDRLGMTDYILMAFGSIANLAELSLGNVVVCVITVVVDRLIDYGIDSEYNQFQSMFKTKGTRECDALGNRADEAENLRLKAEMKKKLKEWIISAIGLVINPLNIVPCIIECITRWFTPRNDRESQTAFRTRIRSYAYTSPIIGICAAFISFVNIAKTNAAVAQFGDSDLEDDSPSPTSMLAQATAGITNAIETLAGKIDVVMGLVPQPEESVEPIKNLTDENAPVKCTVKCLLCIKEGISTEMKCLHTSEDYTRDAEEFSGAQLTLTRNTEPPPDQGPVDPTAPAEAEAKAPADETAINAAPEAVVVTQPTAPEGGSGDDKERDRHSLSAVAVVTAIVRQYPNLVDCEIDTKPVFNVVKAVTDVLYTEGLIPSGFPSNNEMTARVLQSLEQVRNASREVACYTVFREKPNYPDGWEVPLICSDQLVRTYLNCLRRAVCAEFGVKKLSPNFVNTSDKLFPQLLWAKFFIGKYVVNRVNLDRRCGIDYSIDTTGLIDDVTVLFYKKVQEIFADFKNNQFFSSADKLIIALANHLPELDIAFVARLDDRCTARNKPGPSKVQEIKSSYTCARRPRVDVIRLADNIVAEMDLEGVAPISGAAGGFTAEDMDAPMPGSDDKKNFLVRFFNHFMSTLKPFFTIQAVKDFARKVWSWFKKTFVFLKDLVTGKVDVAKGLESVGAKIGQGFKQSLLPKWLQSTPTAKFGEEDFKIPESLAKEDVALQRGWLHWVKNTDFITDGRDYLQLIDQGVARMFKRLHPVEEWQEISVLAHIIGQKKVYAHRHDSGITLSDAGVHNVYHVEGNQVKAWSCYKQTPMWFGELRKMLLDFFRKGGYIHRFEDEYGDDVEYGHVYSIPTHKLTNAINKRYLEDVVPRHIGVLEFLAGYFKAVVYVNVGDKFITVTPNNACKDCYVLFSALDRRNPAHYACRNCGHLGKRGGMLMADREMIMDGAFVPYLHVLPRFASMYTEGRERTVTQFMDMNTENQFGELRSAFNSDGTYYYKSSKQHQHLISSVDSPWLPEVKTSSSIVRHFCFSGFNYVDREVLLASVGACFAHPVFKFWYNNEPMKSEYTNIVEYVFKSVGDRTAMLHAKLMEENHKVMVEIFKDRVDVILGPRMITFRNNFNVLDRKVADCYTGDRLIPFIFRRMKSTQNVWCLDNNGFGLVNNYSELLNLAAFLGPAVDDYLGANSYYLTHLDATSFPWMKCVAKGRRFISRRFSPNFACGMRFLSHDLSAPIGFERRLKYKTDKSHCAPTALIGYWLSRPYYNHLTFGAICGLSSSVPMIHPELHIPLVSVRDLVPSVECPATDLVIMRAKCQVSAFRTVDVAHHVVSMFPHREYLFSPVADSHMPSVILYDSRQGLATLEQVYNSLAQRVLRPKFMHVDEGDTFMSQLYSFVEKCPGRIFYFGAKPAFDKLIEQIRDCTWEWGDVPEFFTAAFSSGEKKSVTRAKRLFNQAVLSTDVGHIHWCAYNDSETSYFNDSFPLTATLMEVIVGNMMFSDWAGVPSWVTHNGQKVVVLKCGAEDEGDDQVLETQAVSSSQPERDITTCGSGVVGQPQVAYFGAETVDPFGKAFSKFGSWVYKQLVDDELHLTPEAPTRAEIEACHKEPEPEYDGREISVTSVRSFARNFQGLTSGNLHICKEVGVPYCEVAYAHASSEFPRAAIYGAGMYSIESFQSLIDQVAHIKGKEWDDLKRIQRVYLPKTTELEVASRAYAKINQMDDDLRLLANAKIVLDLTSGQKGFAHYIVNKYRTTKRMVLMNNLRRPGHASSSIDFFVGGQSCSVDAQQIGLPTWCDGDIRYHAVKNAFQNSLVDYSANLIIWDGGEASANLRNESGWYLKKHSLYNVANSSKPIDVNTAPMDVSNPKSVLSRDIAGALCEYKSLLAENGTMIVKMLGCYGNQVEIIEQLTRGFREVLAYKCLTTSYVSREWYLVMRNYSNKKRATSFINVRAFCTIVNRELYRGVERGVDLMLAYYKRYKTSVAHVMKSVSTEEAGSVLDYKNNIKVLGLKYYPWVKPTGAFKKPADVTTEEGLNAVKAILHLDAQAMSRLREEVVIMNGAKSMLPSDRYFGVDEFSDKICVDKWFNKDGAYSFKTRQDETFREVEKLCRLRGKRVGPPRLAMNNLLNVGRIMFKSREANSRHPVNTVIYSCLKSVFGFSKNNSCMGHTQGTEAMKKASDVKRVDFIPPEPNVACQEKLYHAYDVCGTAEYQRIADKQLNFATDRRTAGGVDFSMKTQPVPLFPFNKRTIRNASGVSSHSALDERFYAYTGRPTVDDPTVLQNHKIYRSLEEGDFMEDVPSWLKPKSRNAHDFGHGVRAKGQFVKSGVQLIVCPDDLNGIIRGKRIVSRSIVVAHGGNNDHTDGGRLDESVLERTYRSSVCIALGYMPELFFSNKDVLVIPDDAIQIAYHYPRLQWQGRVYANCILQAAVKSKVSIPNTWDWCCVKLKGNDVIDQMISLGYGRPTKERMTEGAPLWVYVEGDELDALLRNPRGFKKTLPGSRVGESIVFHDGKHRVLATIANSFKGEASFKNIRTLDIKSFESIDASLRESKTNNKSRKETLDNIAKRCQGLFEPWCFAETVSHIQNLQGKAGLIDHWDDIESMLRDPTVESLFNTYMATLQAGGVVPRLLTSRLKNEPKAKANVDDNGVLQVKRNKNGTAAEDLSVYNAVVARKIQFASLMDRVVEFALFGPIVDYHNNYFKLFKGSSTGIPLYKLGNVLRACADIYHSADDSEFVRTNNGETKLNDLYVVGEKIDVANVAYLSGDFSKWDATFGHYERFGEFLKFARIYHPKYHPMLINFCALTMNALMVNEDGDIYLVQGQRFSGELKTSVGNTSENNDLHVAATADSLNMTAEQAAKAHALVATKVKEGDSPFSWKPVYVSRITHLADGDDNIHIGDAADCNKLDAEGARFLTMCGKTIRNGNKVGYIKSGKFESLSYCSHRFDRVKFCAKSNDFSFKQVYEESGVPLSMRNAADTADGSTIRYMPTRPFTEIFGKLAGTVKVSATRMNVNGSSQNNEMRQLDAIEITRGKILSYFIQYIHLAVVRLICIGILSVLGVGKAQFDDWRRRGIDINFAEIIDYRSALRSVYGIDDIRRIQTISPRDECRFLRHVRANSQLDARDPRYVFKATIADVSARVDKWVSQVQVQGCQKQPDLHKEFVQVKNVAIEVISNFLKSLDIF